MNKNLLVILGVLSLISYKTQAQEVVFVTQEAPQMQYYGTYPEVLVHIPPVAQDNVIMQNASFIENQPSVSPALTQQQVSVAQNDNTDTTKENTNISYYVQNLNLTPEQISKAQKISDESRAQQEQLLQNIQTLRQQAHDLEEKSLSDFEAILTEEQKTDFNRLKNKQDNVGTPDDSQQKTEKEPEPEPKSKQQPSTEPDTTSESAPEAKTKQE